VTTADFLGHLQGLGVKIRIKGDNLHCSARKGLLTPELRAELARRKRDILASLPSNGDYTTADRPALRRVIRGDQSPLSFGQQRIWFLSQLDKGNPFYNVPEAVRLRAAASVAALGQVFSEIVRRHEVLRTKFAVTNGHPVQVLVPAEPIVLSLIDLRDVTGSEREDHVRKLATQEAQRSWDLGEAPLLRTL
jgi:hypothetical protein